MPQPPDVDGLPWWLAVPLTLIFGIGVLLTGLKGYLNREPGKDDGTSAKLISAQIADMGAIRHLSDVCARLAEKIDSLDASINEQTHHLRNKHEVDRELCQRIRELRERADQLLRR